jgi:putative ABC transport system permease protein
MSFWRQSTRGVRSLLNRSAADRDIADEVEHYFDEAAASLEESGLSPEEARRAVRLQYGHATGVRERVRGYGWENIVDTVGADVRYGARQLCRRPAFALIATLTLALGIGASTTIFSVVNPVLLQPLPYPDAGRLMTIWDGQNGRSDITFGTYREVAARNRAFESLAVVGRPLQPTLTGVAEPERLEGQYVSANFFRTLGVAPALGRDFEAADDRPWRPGGPFVVLISDGLWRRRFSADPAIVGRQVLFADTPVTIIGVLPRAFENVLKPSAEIWSPLQYDPALPLNGREWGHHLRMIGRLRDGVRKEDVKRELDAIARTPVAEFPRAPWASLRGGFIATSLQDDLTRGVRPALLVIFAGAVLLLTIACVNVTNLILARGADRGGELTVRAALGASRARLIRQLLAETLLLVSIGGLIGIALAFIVVDLVVALIPPELPRVSAIAVDAWAMAFAFGLVTSISVLVGMVPALEGSRASLRSGAGQRSTPSVRHDVTRRTLLVAQVALALVLLVGAGLLLRSLRQLFAVPTGFDSTNVLTLQVQTAGRRFGDPATTHQFFAQVLEAVRQVPGVSAAGATTQLALTGDEDVWGVQFESAPPSAANESPDGHRYAVSPGYFETLRIPLRQGRLLNAYDTANGPLVAVINESFARRRLPGVDPIGHRLRIGPSPWFTVVGIVGDVRQASLAVRPADAVYVTNEQWTQFADLARWLVVRAGGDAAALTPAIRAAIASVDKDQPVLRIATMDQRVSASAAQRQFTLMLFEAFGVVALILAAVGTYGLLSATVAERVREIAVRTTLGATRISVLGLVLRQGMSLAVAGIVIGLAGAAIASRFLETMLFGISRLDALTYVGVVVLLATTSALACWMPARRAARLDPNVVLRSD